MQQELETRLRDAQVLEADDPGGAAEAYESILERYPRLISAHLRLSEVRQRLSQYRRSRSILDFAVESLMQTQRWQALPFVTLRLLAFGERELIKSLIAKADWSHSAIVRQSPTLSQHLWLSGGYAEALGLLDRVSPLLASDPMLSYSRANALRYSGRMEEATEELEKCIALSPHYPFAHWSLAYHAKAEHPGQRVDRIRRAMRALAADMGAQTYLNYALFKELDDAGDSSAAWRALAEGALLKRRSIMYDADAEALALSTLRQMAVSSAPILTESGETHVPIFVVGLPRTGTTLLERILSNHPAVATAGELGDFVQSLSWELDQFATAPPSLETVRNLGQLDFSALGRRYLLRTFGYAQGRGFLIDKNPANVFHAWAIARAMPQARIVCLLRDPMDACFSNLKELFSGQAYGYSYDLAELAAHHRAFEQTVKCWQELLPDQFLAIRYEDLVADTERVIAQVVQFCGLEQRTGLADITKNETPVLTASSAQVKEPIHSRNIGAWERYREHLQPLQDRLAVA